jgi:hypothetical protein
MDLSIPFVKKLQKFFAPGRPDATPAAPAIGETLAPSTRTFKGCALSLPY